MRSKSSILPISSVLVIAFFLQTNVFAEKIDAASYPYPYKDPYLATTTVAILQGTEHPPTSKIRDLQVKVYDHRNDIYLLKGKGQLRYRLYQQKGPAPLVFIVPGLSSSAYAGSARFLAEWIADHGFHVLVIPSPSNWNFTLAASASGYPGDTGEDAKDLYLAMQLALIDVRSRCRIRIGKMGMLGLSDGALYAGFVSKLDAERKQLGFDAYLLINPPVDVFEAIRKIDEMAAVGKQYGSGLKTRLRAYGFGVAEYAMGDDINDPEYFADWDKRFRLEDDEIKYLIGKDLHDSVGDTIYVISLATDKTILNTPISWGDRSGREEEARAFSIMDYVEKILIPGLRRSGRKHITLQSLTSSNSLRAIKSELESNPKVFLMHNRDDILVTPENVDYLEKVLGERATIYPLGGHLGNLWYPQNKQHILEVFERLR